MRRGIPLTLRPNVVVDTGRASYSDVIHQLPRGGGIRECIVARSMWSTARDLFHATLRDHRERRIKICDSDCQSGWRHDGFGWLHQPWWKVVINAVLRSFQPQAKKLIIYTICEGGDESDRANPPCTTGYGIGLVLHVGSIP